MVMDVVALATMVEITEEIMKQDQTGYGLSSLYL